MWVFTGAPYINWISSQPRLRGALSAITAAVVGGILNLSIWFSLNVLFHTVNTVSWGPMRLLVPDFSTANTSVLAITAMVTLLMFKFHWNIVYVLVVSATAGLLVSLV